MLRSMGPLPVRWPAPRRYAVVAAPPDEGWPGVRLVAVNGPSLRASALGALSYARVRLRSRATNRYLTALRRSEYPAVLGVGTGVCQAGSVALVVPSVGAWCARAVPGDDRSRAGSAWVDQGRILDAFRHTHPAHEKRRVESAREGSGLLSGDVDSPEFVPRAWHLF